MVLTSIVGIVDNDDMASSVLGKTALVTGAGSGSRFQLWFFGRICESLTQELQTGINFAFARLLLSRGCNVVFADLALRPEAREVVDNYGHPPRDARPLAVFQKTDVASWSDLSAAYDATKDQFGRVDIVCPGAGVFEPPWSSFWRPPGTGPEVADTVIGNGYKSININLVHPIRLTQLAILDHIRELRRGNGSSTHPKKTILHVSSVNGQVAPLWTPLYNASKHALNGFVRTLAPLEKNLGIRVVAVAPGLVKTPLWSDNSDKQHPLSANATWVTGEDVAQVMLNTIERDELPAVIRPATDEQERESGVPVVGGSIIEVSGNTVRDVKAFLDPGPQDISPEDFDIEKMEQGVFEHLRQSKVFQ